MQQINQLIEIIEYIKNDYISKIILNSLDGEKSYYKIEKKVNISGRQLLDILIRKYSLEYYYFCNPQNKIIGHSTSL